jgi:elongation factor Ts
MAAITAALVKELRVKTGAGMMDCKKALGETDGDLDAAVDWLRTKGLAAAAKKSGRVAAEGLVGISTGGGAGAIIEVNSETDFVARNETFQQFVKTMADLALSNEADLEKLVAVGFPGENRTIAEQLTHLIATIGENMSLRRVASIRVEPGIVAGYSHAAAAPGLGKIGVIVGLQSSAPAEQLEALGKQLAMHIAATNPQAISAEDLPADVVAREREVLTQQARESGRPENIIEKMVEGRMRKFFEDSTLLSQTWVIDGESKVGDVVAKAAKDAGTPIEITGFVRFGLGEGIEKKDSDFATEVAEAVGG